MRFISKYRRYKIGARKPLSEPTPTGKRVYRHGFVCEFKHGGVREYEKDVARKTFSIKGQTVERDEVTRVDPFSGPGSRLSVFDTDDPLLNAQWAEWETIEKGEDGKPLPKGTIKKEIEDFLLNYSSHGIDYVVVEPIKLKAPWPKYDSLVPQGARTLAKVAEQIAATAAQIGIDPEIVKAYERANLDRPVVLAALEVPVEEAEVLVSA
jgi:hypothetical protein